MIGCSPSRRPSCLAIHTHLSRSTVGEADYGTHWRQGTWIPTLIYLIKVLAATWEATKRAAARLTRQGNEMSTATKSTREDPRAIQLERHADKERFQWTMPSASGRARITCALVGYSKYPGTLLCEVETSREFWPRGHDGCGEGTVPDLQVNLPQVLINLASLKSLRERLVEWQVNPSAFALELGAAKGDQQLTLAIGQVQGLICSVEKPACTLTYACGAAMQGRWSFVVDQSCIRLCAEAMAEFFRSTEPPLS